MSWYHQYKVADSRFMYHVAPQSARDSILHNGLHPTIGRPEVRTITERAPAGVYMGSDESTARRYMMIFSGIWEQGVDLWQVNVDGLHLIPDPQMPAASYTPDPIGPERVQLLDSKDWNY